jgi:hypothetical protein
MTRRHRPVPTVRKSIADVRRPSPSIRQVDGAIQSRPTIAPVDRVRQAYAGSPIPTEVPQTQASGAKNTELRSKIARLNADHDRLRQACTALLVAISGGDVDGKIRAAAKAVAALLEPTPEAP